METSSNNKNQILRTHYYNNSYSEVKETIISLIKERFARIDGVDDEYMEINMYDYVYSVTFIIHVDDLLSIDLLVISPLFYNKKKYIKALYEVLDSKLKLVRIG